MERIMDADAWFVLTALLAPVGYVLQDVVADAMTVEAVPRFDAEGRPTPEDARKLMHTTMQTLGRVAIIGGTVLVAGANVWLFRGAEQMPEAAKAATYLLIYQLALIIPAVSVLGVLLAGFIRRRDARRLAARGLDAARIDAMLDSHPGRPPVNGWILGGGLVFAVVSLSVGLGNVPAGQEIIFGASMAIVVFLMWKLVRELDPDARATLVGTALVIFVFRALPGPGAGSTWWMIDALKFDQQFLATLSLLTSGFTLLGLFLFRRFMAERSIAYIVGFLTVVGTVLALPIVGMYFGLHEWTARHTGGVVDARFIALFDTALESPLGQVAMVPMLAWIARSAPDRLKATYFAVMASFTNLALSAAQLGTKYLNQIYAVTREVKDAATGAIKVPADYSQLGDLLILSTALGFALPLLAIVFVKSTRFRSA
jgi:BT1 family